MVTMKEIEKIMNDAIDRRFNSWDLASEAREQSITWQFKIPGTGSFTMTLVKNSDDGVPHSWKEDEMSIMKPKDPKEAREHTHHGAVFPVTDEKNDTCYACEGN